MTFDQIPPASAIFVDANTLVYHFSAHPKYGAACTRLVERIENQDIQGHTSTHVLGDLMHRLMTIEAMARFGWPAAGIAARLRKHHADIAQLASYQQVPIKVSQLGLRIMPLTEAMVLAAPAHCSQYQLLTGDALIIAAMQSQGLSNLASHDGDFDRVPGSRVTGRPKQLVNRG